MPVGGSVLAASAEIGAGASGVAANAAPVATEIAVGLPTTEALSAAGGPANVWEGLTGPALDETMEATSNVVGSAEVAAATGDPVAGLQAVASKPNIPEGFTIGPSVLGSEEAGLPSGDGSILDSPRNTGWKPRGDSVSSGHATTEPAADGVAGVDASARPEEQLTLEQAREQAQADLTREWQQKHDQIEARIIANRTATLTDQLTHELQQNHAIIGLSGGRITEASQIPAAVQREIYWFRRGPNGTRGQMREQISPDDFVTAIETDIDSLIGKRFTQESGGKTWLPAHKNGKLPIVPAGTQITGAEIEARVRTSHPELFTPEPAAPVVSAPAEVVAARPTERVTTQVAAAAASTTESGTDEPVTDGIPRVDTADRRDSSGDGNEPPAAEGDLPIEERVSNAATDVRREEQRFTDLLRDPDVTEEERHAQERRVWEARQRSRDLQNERDVAAMEQRMKLMEEQLRAQAKLLAEVVAYINETDEKKKQSHKKLLTELAAALALAFVSDTLEEVEGDVKSVAEPARG